MKYTRTRHQIGAILVSLALIATAKSAMAEEPTPGYNTKIPESIMTPDTVPAFLFGDFKEIGHRDKSISIGHQTELIRFSFQYVCQQL